MRRTILGFTMLLALAVGAAAGEPPRTPAEIADKVVRWAAEGNDEAAFELASALAPDPWLVVDELCARGEFDAAERFVATGNTARTEGLAEFLAGQRQMPTTPKARALLARVLGAIHKREFAPGLESLARLETGPDDVIWIRLHHALGNLLRDTGDTSRAAEVYVATADRARRIKWWYREADLMHVSAEMAYQSGDVASALERWERSRQAWVRIGHSAAIGQTSTNLGALLYSTGDLSRATAMHEEAIRAYRRIGNVRGVAENLARLGHIRLRRGEYARALTLYEEAEAEAAGARDLRGQARAWQSAGNVHARLGDLDRAHDLEVRARDAYRKLRQAGPYVLAVLTLASLERMRGNLDASDELTREALGICRKRNDEARALLALGGLAENRLQRGDWAGAGAAYAEVLAAIGVDGDPQPRSWAHRGLALVSLLSGEIEAADKHANAAVAAARPRGGADLAGALEVRVRVSLEQGRVADAVAAAREAVLLIDESTEDLSTIEAASGRDRRAGIFETALRAGLASGDPEEVFHFIEAGRAGALVQAIGGRAALRSAELPPGLAEELDAAQVTVRETSDALSVARAGGRRREVREAREAYDAARTTHARLLGRAERRRRILTRAATRLTQDLAACRKSLHPHQSLVLFASAADRTVAVVVTREEARLVSLGTTETIISACADLRADERETATGKAAVALRSLLISPLALPKSARAVAISPSDALSRVPFTLLLPDRELSYVPSSTVLALLREEITDGSDGVLAIGDPRYSLPGAAPGRSTSTLAPLPASRAEASSVGSVVLLGEDATEGAVRRRLRRETGRWRAVHFACHGILDPDHPLRSSLALTPGGGDDGFLTGLEVLDEGVDAELAVLSACSTGRGKVFRGEGLVGLSTAFMLAGCPRVLASLWDVPDDATARLMKEFYEAWDGEGNSAAAALLRAQRIVAAVPRWEHPVHWAGWVLWGPPE